MTDPAAVIDPVARVEPIRRNRWVWLIPAAAVIFAAMLAASYVEKRGRMITITAGQGHGIKAGDVLRCRGIVIGEVERVRLTGDLNSVAMEVRLDPTAEAIARQGSRFWIVRPRVSITGVGGLETVTGPRYVAALPGSGESASEFKALPDPPVLESMDPEGLELVLIANQRGSLRAGAPVAYRQQPIGTVTGVELALDARAVVARIYVEPRYVHLVRDNSVFWNVSGVDWSLGISGLRMEMESMQAMLDGGVALATPDEPGGLVADGHRFTLKPRVDEDWLRWRPSLERKP